MKYFKLQEAPEGKRGPQIMNWYGSFDVRNIRMEGFPKFRNASYTWWNQWIR